MKSDISGQKFNKLTVLNATSDFKNNERLFLCLCECGNKATVTKFNLVHDRTKSCGCLVTQHAPNRKTRKINITGQKFGRLLVIQEYIHTKILGIHWMCQCECGKMIVASGIDLRRGSIKSCGCLSRDNLIKINKNKRVLGSWDVDISIYKKSAKQRSIDFNLNEEEFKKLVSANCYYCGRKPFVLCVGAELKETNTHKNGIDRIDSSKGYTQNNCISCCKFCNLEKKDQDINQFILNTKLRYEHLKSIGKI